jgi:hypothetical protein
MHKLSQSTLLCASSFLPALVETGHQPMLIFLPLSMLVGSQRELRKVSRLMKPWMGDCSKGISYRWEFDVLLGA